MHFASFLVHIPSKYRLTFLRRMGGGPRTFPGGINKWQWKRLHEKKAREKEKRLLDQEKQLYQARVRSEIRAKVASAENPGFKPDKNQPNYAPRSPEDHIKALADRFMKEGAEDLWNDNDGPVAVPMNQRGKTGFVGDPIDLRKMVAERSSSSSNGGDEFQKSDFLGNFSGGVAKPRLFSTYANNSMAAFGSEHFRNMSNGFNLVGNYRRGVLMGVSKMLNSNCYYSVDAAYTKPKRLNFVRNSNKSVANDGVDAKRNSGGGRRDKKWPRFRGRSMNTDDDDSDDYDYDDNDVEMGSGKKILSSSAALGKYDRKFTKRVPLERVEDEVDMSQEVMTIKENMRQWKIMQDEGKDEESVVSTKRFDECGVSPLTVQALTEAGYVQMTMVQEATLCAFLEGKDALVKARAGTGKSIAFLLPAIETVLKASKSTKQRVPPIYVLILCPARELASQLAAEANVLLKHHVGIGVQTLIGGTRFKLDQKRLESEPCQILIATPGRLLDHIENKSGISARLMGLQMLVLDEADRLLDLGYRKDVEKIVDCLPRKKQSLLFSATIPKEVRRISQLVLKREHAYINTLGLESMETNAKVKQFYLVANHEQHFEIVHHLLKSHMSEVPQYKVIVFCGTAMMTSLMFSLFRGMNLNVRELHSKKPPLYRTRVSEEFKEAKKVILVTSDVFARGLNYPDVTLVVQVGIPPDRGQYIHRLGRTGRQGKDGEGYLLLAPWEQYFLDDIKDLPIEKLPSPELDPDVSQKMHATMDRIDTSIKEAAYHAWLGYYNSINAIGRDKTTLVELANKFGASIGLQKPPPLFRKTALKMGLKGIPGIQIRK